MLVSLEGTAVEFWEVPAGQTLVWEPGRAGCAVQRESTATGADLAGLAYTLWDGDLRR
jgi:hypothetical protein